MTRIFHRRNEATLEPGLSLSAALVAMDVSTDFGCVRNWLVSVAAWGDADEQPNCVVIFADDLGCNYVGYSESQQIETPEIDWMAAEGRRSTNFYVAAPTGAPSGIALLTACDPVSVRIDNIVSDHHEGQPKLFSHCPKQVEEVGIGVMAPVL